MAAPRKKQANPKRPKPGRGRSATGSGARAAKPAGSAGATILAKVRRTCLLLPDSTEKIAWGAPTFRVRERLFVMFLDNHHGDGRLAIWVNAPPGAQDAFVASDPECYFIPPYVGPSGWLGVRLDRKLRWSEVVRRIEAAHQATLDKRRAR